MSARVYIDITEIPEGDDIRVGWAESEWAARITEIIRKEATDAH